MRVPSILVCALFAAGCVERSNLTVLEATPNTRLSDVDKDVVSVEVQGPAVVFLARGGRVLAAAYQGEKEKVKVILPLRSVASGSAVWLQVNHRPAAISAFTRDGEAPSTSAEASPDFCVQCSRYEDGERARDPQGNFLTTLVCCSEN